MIGCRCVVQSFDVSAQLMSTQHLMKPLVHISFDGCFDLTVTELLADAIQNHPRAWQFFCHRAASHLCFQVRGYQSQTNSSELSEGLAQLISVLE